MTFRFITVQGQELREKERSDFRCPVRYTNTTVSRNKTDVTYRVSTALRNYKQLSELRSIQEAIQTAITLTVYSDDNLIITRSLN
jgi:hypothetical protein